MDNQENAQDFSDGASVDAGQYGTTWCNPLNMILLCVCSFLLYKIIRAKKQHSRLLADQNTLPPLKRQDFTLEQLREMNNKDGRILMAVNGKVFDVTKERGQYGPDGPYGVFAGRDASRGLGTFSLTGDAIRDTYDDLSDLTPSQMESIKEWELQFSDRFQFLGRLLKPGEEPTEYTDTEEEHGLGSSQADPLKLD